MSSPETNDKQQGKTGYTRWVQVQGSQVQHGDGEIGMMSISSRGANGIC